MYRFRDIIANFQKVKEVTWQWPRPLEGRFVICRLKLAMFNPHTKFEVSTITCNEELKNNAKCKNFVFFEPPFVGLTGNAQSLSMARWKVHYRLPISDNWTFLLALTAAAPLSEICRNRPFMKGWVTLSAYFYKKKLCSRLLSTEVKFYWQKQ